MEDKYYTPEIEEFHVGFECEIINIENAQWGKWVIKDVEELSECPSSLSIEGHLQAEFIRVKYLDKEDIESLKFKYIGNSLYEGIKNLMHVKFYNTNFPNYQWVIKHNYYGVLFKGKIKNKSELKRILKQLNI